MTEAPTPTLTHAPASPSTLDRLDALLAALNRAREAISAVVVGQEQVVEQVLVALLAGGHVLLEGAPGMG